MKPWRNISIEDFHLDTKPWTWGLILLASLFFALWNLDYAFLQHWNYAIYLKVDGLFYLPFILTFLSIPIFCLGVLFYRKNFFQRLLAYAVFFCQVSIFIAFLLSPLILYAGFGDTNKPTTLFRGIFSIVCMPITAFVTAKCLSKIHKLLKTPYRFGIWFWVVISLLASLYTYILFEINRYNTDPEHTTTPIVLPTQILEKIPYSPDSGTIVVYQIPSQWNGLYENPPPPPTTYITVEKPGTIPKTIFVTHSWCTPRHIQWMDKNHVQVEHYRINLQSLFPQQELKVEDCYLGGVGDVRQTPEYKKLLKQPYFHDD